MPTCKTATELENIFSANMNRRIVKLRKGPLNYTAEEYLIYLKGECAGLEAGLQDNHQIWMDSASTFQPGSWTLSRYVLFLNGICTGLQRSSQNNDETYSTSSISSSASSSTSSWPLRSPSPDPELQTFVARVGFAQHRAELCEHRHGVPTSPELAQQHGSHSEIYKKKQLEDRLKITQEHLDQHDRRSAEAKHKTAELREELLDERSRILVDKIEDLEGRLNHTAATLGENHGGLRHAVESLFETLEQNSVLKSKLRDTEQSLNERCYRLAEAEHEIKELSEQHGFFRNMANKWYDDFQRVLKDVAELGKENRTLTQEITMFKEENRMLGVKLDETARIAAAEKHAFKYTTAKAMEILSEIPSYPREQKRSSYLLSKRRVTFG